MNTKIVGGLLALVLIVQVVLVGAGTKMSEKISSINVQQASIISKVDQVAALGASGVLNPGPTPGGITIITYYLYNRCTVTTYSDAGTPSTSQGYTVSTPSGQGCDTSGPQSATAGTGTGITNNIVPLRDGGVSIRNSSDIVSTEIKFIKSR